MSKLQGKLRGIFEILSKTGVVVSNILYVYPYLGKILILTTIFLGMGGSTTNWKMWLFFPPRQRPKPQSSTILVSNIPPRYRLSVSKTVGLNWRRLRRSHGFRLEDFFGGLKVYFFPCHVIFGVSLTILCSSNCRKQVGSLLCAARWHLFVDTMHCWVLHHKYNKYIQFGSLAVWQCLLSGSWTSEITYMCMFVYLSMLVETKKSCKNIQR